MFRFFKKDKGKNSPRTILVVEDTETDRLLIQKTMEHEGYHVITAHNGKEGLEKAVTSRPDLILLDCLMPAMDGLTMAAKLRESDVTMDIPIIFLTSLDTPKNVVECFEVDAENFLTKPVNPKVLIDQVILSLKEHPAQSH